MRHIEPPGSATVIKYTRNAKFQVVGYPGYFGVLGMTRVVYFIAAISKYQYSRLGLGLEHNRKACMHCLAGQI